jgi:hypothetical protein
MTQALEQLDRGLDTTTPNGTTSVLVSTTTVASYPTSAGSFFACVPQAVDGTEAEGSAATYVAESSSVIYVYNTGTAIPTPNTMILAHLVGGRWVMRFDG